MVVRTPAASKATPDPSVWLVPVGASLAEVQRSRELLGRSRAVTEIIDVEALRRLLDDGRPRAAILLGGAVSASLLDAQRWLHEFRVTTMVVVDDLTPHFEATLLERGAQDVVRASSPRRILAARFEALVRHSGERVTEPRRDAMRLHIDSDARLVRLGDQTIDLTRSEFDLLLTLTRRPGVVVTRMTLALALQEHAVSPRALESRVSRLRQKLRRHHAGDLVETVRGVGYRFNPDGVEPPLAPASGTSDVS